MTQVIVGRVAHKDDAIEHPRQRQRAAKKKYEIAGYLPKSRKYPILMKEISTGKCYKFTTEEITRIAERMNVAKRLASEIDA